MNTNLLPFNITLLTLKDEDLRGIRPVKVLDIFSGGSKNFHEDGLFSTETFGKVGEERRNRMFSYIDLKIEVFHPVIFKALTDLKTLYGDIIASKEYAIFDKATKDFIKSDPIDGDTGFSFFLKHFKELKFEERPSAKREFNIKLIDKFRNNCTFSKFVVLPAGLRDYIIEDSGKPSEDEINGLYRKVISISSMIDNINSEINIEYLNNIRYNLQLAVIAVYDYIKNMLEGKSKLVLGKWASRKIHHSTRNVITSFIPQTKVLHDERTVSTNQTIVGLYQYLRAILPLAIKHVRDTYLSDVFVGPNSPAILVNKKTLKKEMVTLSPEHYDDWMTYEGLEKLMARYGQENLRHDYLEIDGYYLGLIYKGSDNTFKFVQDKDELPSGRDEKDLHPITLTELIYMSVYKDADTIPCFVTRYPITGYGSVYPSYVYLKSTVKAEVRRELNDNWEPIDIVAKEFPVVGDQFFNSLCPAPSHIGRLDADYDGDTMSFTCVMTEDAKAEIKKTLNSQNYYVGVNAKMAFSANTDIIELVLANMTK
jgi:hypothetical protein